ncbi:MAG: HAD family hydrolase [Candidatus Thiodiazotropha sp.]
MNKMSDSVISGILSRKKALLLDMNSTFMFGEDRFGSDEDYSVYYKSIGGKLSDETLNTIMQDILQYLGKLYPKEEYRNHFPSVAQALDNTLSFKLSTEEVDKIVQTFSYHEHGYIPEEYIKALFQLRERYILSVVIDIWAPKTRWLETFKKHGIDTLFSAQSFSSDHGIVKPSPRPFEMVVEQLDIDKEDCLVVGDSIRRDLGGAIAANIDCVLVGGSMDDRALAAYEDLLVFCDYANNS